MDFFNVVNEAQEAGVPDVKIRLYYQNNKAEMAGPATSESLFVCSPFIPVALPKHGSSCF